MCISDNKSDKRKGNEEDAGGGRRLREEQRLRKTKTAIQKKKKSVRGGVFWLDGSTNRVLSNLLLLVLKRVLRASH